MDRSMFWIHNVHLKKNSETLSPATTQVLKERQSSSIGSIPRNEEKVTDKYLSPGIHQSFHNPYSSMFLRSSKMHSMTFLSALKYLPNGLMTTPATLSLLPAISNISANGISMTTSGTGCL